MFRLSQSIVCKSTLLLFCVFLVSCSTFPKNDDVALKQRFERWTLGKTVKRAKFSLELRGFLVSEKEDSDGIKYLWARKGRTIWQGILPCEEFLHGNLRIDNEKVVEIYDVHSSCYFHI